MIKIDDFLVVSYFTIDTPYEFVLSQYLLPSLEKLNIAHHIEAVENKGSWLKNVAQKPQVIGRALEKYPGKNIVFLDADAEILEFPILFNNIPEEYDLACHYLDWKTWYNNGNDRQELLSGTLFLRNNEKVHDLVTQWFLRANGSDEWEQKVLEKLIGEKEDIKVYNLPLSYCYIKSLPHDKEPLVKIENPIIIHNQVSRQLKKKIH